MLRINLVGRLVGLLPFLAVMGLLIAGAIWGYSLLEDEIGQVPVVEDEEPTTDADTEDLPPALMGARKGKTGKPPRDIRITVVEGAKRHSLAPVEGLVIESERIYGDTVVRWLIKDPGDDMASRGNAR